MEYNMTKTHLIFSGQGSQFVGMGRDFHDAIPEVRDMYRKADDLLGYSISDISFSDPDARLHLTQYTQPAIFLASVAMYHQLPSEIAVASVAGHSLGEITAYYAAGVLDFESALRIVAKRGELMGQQAHATDGAMAAVIGLDQDTVSRIVDTIYHCVIANYNTPNQFVISGQLNAIYKAIDQLNKAGARVVNLPVSGAFHSHLMNDAVPIFKDYIDQFTFNPPQYPIYLNREAAPVTDPVTLKANLSVHIVSPVRWIETIRAMMAESNVFVEVGPGKVLTGLVKKIDRSAQVYSTSTYEGVTTMALAPHAI
jgi:[acyl-carrier-protein] S-malonyltransferase